MDYTKRHEEQLTELYMKEQEEEIFEEDILAYLNNDASFLNFGDALKRIIRKKMPNDYPKDECEYLKEVAREQNIIFNRNTLNSWFAGNSPKKGDRDRERMFLICFALRLDVHETTELFQKVYGDRPFNLRNYKEFIFYCCINNCWAYDRAERVIEQVEFSQESCDTTVYTEMIHRNAQSFKMEQDIIRYIENNKHNFDIRNCSAKKKLRELIYEIKGRKDEIVLLEIGEVDNRCSYIAQECFKNPMIWNELKKCDDTVDMDFNKKNLQGKYNKKSFFSVYTMVDIIYGINMRQAREEVEHSLIKNSHLPQAVKGRFPSYQTFNKIDPTSEELRKMIILLYSYKFWILKGYSSFHIGFEEYRDGLDDVLYEVYLQKLYIGNPYDWLFMYCTLSDDSLSLFRTIIGEGLLTD